MELIYACRKEIGCLYKLAEVVRLMVASVSGSDE